MHTILKMGRLRYRICAPSDPKSTLAERIQDLKAYALKCTGRHRRVRSYPSSRLFPPAGLSVLEYVKAYYALNQLGSIIHFAPLAAHMTYPRGVDSYEVG